MLQQPNLKRDREPGSEDTEEERRTFAIELCNLIMTDNLVAPARKIPYLEEVMENRNIPRLHRNREVLNVIYGDVDTIVVEKVHGTTNVVVTYYEKDFNCENAFQPVNRVYIGTYEECILAHPAVFLL